ncbi:reverse transcriptase domain-containing protein [Tanacetum coccineum]
MSAPAPYSQYQRDAFSSNFLINIPGTSPKSIDLRLYNVADSVSVASGSNALTWGDNIDNTTRPREAHVARKYSYKEFMSCQPINFKGTEGVVGLIRWFERTELVFSRSNCMEDCKVKFATGILPKEALSWWNSFAFQNILEIEKLKVYGVDFKKLLIRLYCPRTEVQKMEDEFYHLTMKGNDLKTYVRRFQELATLCPTMVLDSKKMMEVFIGGLPRTIKASLSISLASILNIPHITIDTFYNIEMADGNLVSTNTVIQGATLTLLNQPFKIDLMPIKLDSFDVVIGMDWLSKYHARIICDEKVIHIPINGETLIIRVMEKKSNEKRLEDIPVRKTRSIFEAKTKRHLFNCLKQKLCEAPILALPEGNDNFVIYCDASHQGLGAVFKAKERSLQAISESVRVEHVTMPLARISLQMTLVEIR